MQTLFPSQTRQEMQKRRGAAPFGHTQQLTPRWPAGVRISKVCKREESCNCIEIFLN